jgi:uncharacterized membrane protein
MRNYLNPQITGAIVIIFAAILAIPFYYLTSEIQRLSALLHEGCPLPPEVCPYTTFSSISIIGFTVIGVLALYGAGLIFGSKQLRKAELEKKKRIQKTIRNLKSEEKTLYKIIAESGGLIFQSELVKRSGLSKVKVSRILDLLESKGLIEKRRRGMSNIIVLK